MKLGAAKMPSVRPLARFNAPAPRNIPADIGPAMLLPRPGRQSREKTSAQTAGVGTPANAA